MAVSSNDNPEAERLRSCMAVVPWTYNNPRIDRKSQRIQQYSLSGQSIEIIQDTTADINVNQNTGLKLWDGAYILAKHLENTNSFPCGFWKGKRCIELGAGCGLVGMAAWLLGASVTLTDTEDMLEHTKKCVKHNLEKVNGRGSKEVDGLAINTQVYLWGTDCTDLSPPFDIILGSDIIYQQSCVDDLLNTLEKLSGPDTVIFISYKTRGLGEDVFFEKLRDTQFTLSKIPPENHPKECQGTEYELLYLQRDK